MQNQLVFLDHGAIQLPGLSEIWPFSVTCLKRRMAELNPTTVWLLSLFYINENLPEVNDIYS